MTIVLTETRERFLLAIVKQIPVEQIAEVHFFQPIKQGGVESGVAVVAAWPEPASQPEPEHSESSHPEPEQSESSHPEPERSEGEGSPDGADEGDPSVAELPQDDGEVVALPQDEGEVVEAREPRPIIYTARYRLTLKGPDRGKWDTHVVAEADAPLVTLEAVVRGVQRRAGDVDEPTRVDGDEIRALVEAKLHAMAQGLPGHSASA